MKTKSLPRLGQPLKISRGSSTVTIYYVVSRVNGSEYPQFVLSYKLGTRPGKNGKLLDRLVRRKFSDLETAKREADLVVTKLANGQAEVINLQGADRKAYLDACNELRPLNVTLTDAVSQFVKAVNRLPKGTSLAEVVDFFLRRNPASMPQKTVREIVDELMDEKTAERCSQIHLKDMGRRLGRFADAMQMNLSQVTGPMIQKHLTDLNVAGRTRKNHFRHISSLFRFATKKKYLSKDALDEVESVNTPKAELTDIEIFTPGEARELFAAARPELVPWVAIAAFAGLRTAELQRLDWSEVKLAERHIVVPAAKAKTKSRRLVTISDNLFAWLSPYAQPSGRVVKFENMAKQIGWLVDDVNAARQRQAEAAGKDPKNAAKFEWKRNALRHSFISYQTAKIKDVAAVSLEAGNSPQMIFQHYRQLVTEAQAKEWFTIAPDVEANIVPLAASA